MNDNGSCFTGRLALNGAADFERMLRSAGIKQICSRPGHPQTCGKLERSHQTTNATANCNADPSAFTSSSTVDMPGLSSASYAAAHRAARLILR
jgi:transposase InsO family protein